MGNRKGNKRVLRKETTTKFQTKTGRYKKNQQLDVQYKRGNATQRKYDVYEMRGEVAGIRMGKDKDAKNRRRH